jgi:cytochrome c peroxidase
MNRALRALLGLAALVLCVQLLNLVLSHPSGTTLRLLGESDPHVRPVAALFEQKCANCHTTDIRRPPYTWIPGIRNHVEGDIRAGLMEFDLVNELLHGPAASEAALAKIEYVVARHSMPPGDFRAMHWDAHLDDADRQAILDWVHQLRCTHYAPENLPRAVQENALHPLPGADPRLDPRAAALGEKLYSDVRLSADGEVACASCHDLKRGGCDNQRFSKGVRGQRGSVNAPTTFNARFSRAQCWNGRNADLEEQAGYPIESPLVMDTDWTSLCARLEQDAALEREFRAVYPDGITKESVIRALAEFERSLVTPGARFDRYLMGETAALTPSEQHGYQLFKQWGCSTCHVGKTLGGQSFERMGRRADYFGERGGNLPSDSGRLLVTRDPADRHCFKVPSLRNVARTSPYLHDGSVPDLGEAVRVMLHYQVGATLPEADVEAIASFLESLTGEYRGQAL